MDHVTTEVVQKSVSDGSETVPQMLLMTLNKITSWLYTADNKRKKKYSERRKHCTLAVARQSQKYSPAADPLPGAQDGQNLISWRWSLPSPTDPQSHRQTRLITIHCTAS